MSPLSPSTLLPALRPATWVRRRGLSDDGFSDTVVSISLSRDLCVTFVCDGVDVSYRGLGELDLSAHRAWELAAANLVARARTPAGIRVHTRPAAALLGPGAPGLQVALPGAPAASWLAHPHPFTVLDEHLADLTGGPVAWLALTERTVVAVPRGDVGRYAPDLGTALSRAPLERHHGFPAAVSSHTPVPTPA